MREFRVAMPVLVAVMAAISLGINFTAGNTAAAWGYLSALCGWLIVAGDETVKYLDERKYRV